MNINTSDVTFNDLVKPNSTDPTTTQNLHNGGDIKKKKRHDPVIEIREDNLDTVDPDIEAKLLKILGDKEVPQVSDNVVPQVNDKVGDKVDKVGDTILNHAINSLSISEPIIVEPETKPDNTNVVDLMNQLKTDTKPTGRNSKRRNKIPANISDVNGRVSGRVDGRIDQSDQLQCHIEAGQIVNDTTHDDVELNKQIMVIHRYQNSRIFGKYLADELGIHYSTEQ
jgi:hypothetical protein